MSGQGKARYAFESHTHSGLGSGGSGSGGTTIYSGSGSPTSSIGVAGDFYVDTTNKVFWGPKVGSTWPSSFSLAGTPGATGPAGAAGAAGAAGTNGTNGAAATVTVGATSVGVAGTNPVVTNSGTSTNAILNFTIPRGATGATGPQGPQGIQGIQGPAGSGSGSTTSMYVPQGILVNMEKAANSYLFGPSSGVPSWAFSVSGIITAGSSAVTTDSVMPTVASGYYDGMKYWTATATILGSTGLLTSSFGCGSSTSFVPLTSGVEYSNSTDTVRVHTAITSSSWDTVKVPVRFTSSNTSLTVTAQVRCQTSDESSATASSTVTLTNGSWNDIQFTTSLTAGKSCSIIVDLNYSAPTSVTTTVTVDIGSATYGSVVGVYDTGQAALSKSNTIAVELNKGENYSKGALTTDRPVEFVVDTTAFVRNILTPTGSGKYFINLQGVSVELRAPRYLHSVYGESVGSGISAGSNNEYIELDFTLIDTSGSAGYFLVDCWCVPCNTQHHIVTAGSFETSTATFVKLSFHPAMGWVAREHVFNIPPALKTWPYTGTSYSAGDTLVRGYSYRDNNMDQDAGRVIQACVAHVPSSVRNGLKNIGLRYVTGTSNGSVSPEYWASGAPASAAALTYWGPTASQRKIFLPPQQKDPASTIQESDRRVVVHETAHAIDFGYNEWTGAGPVSTFLSSDSSIVSLHAAAIADPAMDHSLYAYTGGRQEWWAESLAQLWMGLSSNLLASMGGSSSRVTTFTNYCSSKGIL